MGFLLRFMNCFCLRLIFYQYVLEISPAFLMSAPQTGEYDSEKTPLILSAQAPRLRRPSQPSASAQACPFGAPYESGLPRYDLEQSVLTYALFFALPAWNHRKFHSARPVARAFPKPTPCRRRALMRRNENEPPRYTPEQSALL